MRTEIPRDIEEVMKHCRDGMKARILPFLDVVWKDDQLQVVTSNGCKPIRVMDDFFNMDNWRLLFDEPT
jgi:hypothetical protein